MPVTLAAPLARAGAALGARSGFATGAGERALGAVLLAQSAATAAGERASAAERAAARRLGRLDAGGRAAIDAASVPLTGEPLVLAKLVANGASARDIADFAGRWERADAAARERVRAPLPEVGAVRLAGVRATQVDGTTCGAASLGVAGLIGDPIAAMWLLEDPDRVAQRWPALQRRLHASITRHGLGPMPWPRSLGSPPWALAGKMRHAGVRFGAVWLDDDSPRDIAALRLHLDAALADGIPVPLYASGDSASGLDAAVPRHVVLAVGTTADGYRVYEPASGSIHQWNPVAGEHPRSPALGNWNRLAVAVLPRPAVR